MAATFVVNAPQGFKGSTLVLNTFPQDLLLESCVNVARFLQYKSAELNAETYRQKLELANVHHTTDAVQGAINALVFLFRGAAQEKLAVDDFVNSLKMYTLLTGSVFPVVKHVWNEQGPSLINFSENKTFSVGKLVSLDWSLGMAVRSSTKDSLDTPYVNIVAHVADASGVLTPTTFELSLSEFKNFLAQMRTISSTLETL